MRESQRMCHAWARFTQLTNLRMLPISRALLYHRGMPYTLRARFKKEIVVEFLPPAPRQARGIKGSKRGMKDKVIILCTGMPSVPGYVSVLKFLSKKGYWVFHPRYRGSWESAGTFLKKSPHEDILDIIDELPKGFTSLWDGKKYRVRPDKIFIIAGSFGGPAGILASRDSRVSKVIAVSPVVDWKKLGPAEPFGFMEKFVARAFGNGYRFDPSGWKKLKSGTFYNPVRHTTEIDGKKLFIFQAKDDESVLWRPVAKFAKVTGAKIKLLKTGGHGKATLIVERYYRDIAKFFKGK